MVLHKGLSFTKNHVFCLKKVFCFNSSRTSDFFLKFSTCVLSSNAHRLVCGIIFLISTNSKKKKKLNFLHSFCRYCCAEHMWKALKIFIFLNKRPFFWQTTSFCQKYMWNFPLQKQKKKKKRMIK